MLQRATAVPVQNWRFRFEDDAWTPITLPHSWNARDALHPGPGRYRRGTGRYGTKLTTPADKRTFLRFGAASQKAIVFWNGRRIGHHAGGYLPFTVELPAGETGRLQVDVDNAPDADLIPSERSDFFLYGGLTRPVLRYETGLVRIGQVKVLP
jgi:beta-galactosidase